MYNHPQQKQRIPSNREIPPQFTLKQVTLKLKERLTKTEFESDEDQYNIWCRICQDILIEPTACKKCKLAFCQSCFDTYLKENDQTCPSGCKNGLQGGPLPRKNNKALKTLFFSCLNLEHGCETMLPYSRLYLHDNECPFRMVSCKCCQEDIHIVNAQEHI